MFNREPIQTRGEGHIQNPRGRYAFYPKAMRDASRLKKVSAGHRYLFSSPQKKVSAPSRT